MFIGICGGTTSGKSKYANRLAQEIGAENTQVIPLNSFYKETGSLTAEEKRNYNFDHPNSINIEELNRALDSLKMGKETAIQDYDYKNNKRKKNVRILEPKKFIILEGTLLFAFHSLRNRMDYQIFVDCPDSIRHERRIKRDTKLHGRDLANVTTQYNRITKPMHDLFVQPFKHEADFIALHHHNFEENLQNILYQIEELISLQIFSQDSQKEGEKTTKL